MARFYADEDFPFPAVERLRKLGHDVLTVHEAGRANQGIDDADVLSDATADRRCVLTHNHSDYRRLHRRGLPHGGIISSTRDDADPLGLADRINAAVSELASLENEFIRVIRPNPPKKS